MSIWHYGVIFIIGAAVFFFIRGAIASGVKAGINAANQPPRTGP